MRTHNDILLWHAHSSIAPSSVKVCTHCLHLTIGIGRGRAGLNNGVGVITVLFYHCATCILQNCRMQHSLAMQHLCGGTLTERVGGLLLSKES